MGRELREARRPERPRHEPDSHAVATEPAPVSTAYVLGLQRTVGNQAVQRMLSRRLLQRAPYIVQAGYMSGDMFGISAALVLNPNSGVVILSETSATEQAKREPDQGEFFRDFYTAALTARGVDPRDIALRVKLVPIENVQAVYKDLVKQQGAHDARVRRAAKLNAWDTFVAPGIATSMVADAYAAGAGAARTKVRAAWTAGRAPTTEQMSTFLAGKGIVPTARYALLWVRLSAKLKKGGAHAELDTSLQGIRDLTARIRQQTDRQVILVGDDPGKPDLVTNAINMLEFWKQAPFNTGTAVEKRMAQLRLFSFMVNSGYDLVSIGMRSGAMEGPALLGVPTVYIEEAGNEQAKRMEKWLGKVPNWTQARVRTLPTRTGRRYKGGPAVDLPTHGRKVRDAASEVQKLSGGDFEVVSARLRNVYHDDLDTFQSQFVTASHRPWLKYPPYRGYDGDFERTATGQQFAAALYARLETWHDEYVAYWEADDECTKYEQAVATAIGARDAVGIRRRLADVKTARDYNAGLADFIRDAIVALGRPAMTPELRDALRKWRSAYTGKWTLDKGFVTEDLDLIMDTPTLRGDRARHIICREIDTLLSEDAGTTATVLNHLVQRRGTPTFNEFLDAFFVATARGVRRLLTLADTVTPAEAKTRFQAYAKTTEGSTLWSTLRPKLQQLHGLAWPG